MAIRTKNIGHRSWPHPNMMPAVLVTGNASQTFTNAHPIPDTIGDWDTSASTIVDLPYPMRCTPQSISYTTASNTFVGTIRVSGVNQFDEQVSVDIDIASGNGTFHPVGPPMKIVTNIETLAYTSGSGNITMGPIRGTGVRIALPFRVKENKVKETGPGHEGAEVLGVTNGANGLPAAGTEYQVDPENNALFHGTTPHAIIHVMADFRPGKNV